MDSRQEVGGGGSGWGGGWGKVGKNKAKYRERGGTGGQIGSSDGWVKALGKEVKVGIKKTSDSIQSKKVKGGAREGTKGKRRIKS